MAFRGMENADREDRADDGCDALARFRGAGPDHGSPASGESYPDRLHRLTAGPAGRRTDTLFPHHRQKLGESLRQQIVTEPARRAGNIASEVVVQGA